MTLEEIEARIRAALPALAYRKAELNTYGEDNYVVVLDGRWIVRLPRSDDHLGRFAAELNLLDVLRGKVSVRVPHYEHVAEGRRMGAYRLIEGREMTPSLFRSLAAGQQRNILGRLAEFLSTLHALPMKILEQPDGTVQRAWRPVEFAAYYRGRQREKIAAVVGAVSLARFDAFFELFERRDLAGVDRLAHGDLSDDHILVSREGALAGVIDFTDACWGNPSGGDFAYFWRLGEDAVDYVLTHYAMSAEDPGLKNRARWIFVRYLITQVAYGNRAKWNLGVDEALAELDPHLRWCGV